MNISNNNPNFQSKIKFINNKSFQQKVNLLNFMHHEVLYPWTVETMKTGDMLYTRKIMECIGAIFTNGETSALLHLATRDEKFAIRDKVKPFDINNIEKVLLSKFNLSAENVHGMILGAWGDNIEYLEQFVQLVKKYKIPFSIIADRKDLHRYGTFSLLFDTKEDTLYISNSLTNNRNYNRFGIINGHEIDVHKDGIAFNTYVKIPGRYGVYYDKIRHKTGPQEFFESQFNRVSLCELDEWA